MVNKLKKSIKIVKTFILIGVVGLLLSVASIKTVTAEKQKTLGIIVITENGQKCVQVQIDDEQIAALKQNINDFEGWLEQNNPLGDLKFNESETDQIRNYVDKILKSLPEDLQLISTEEIVKLITPVPTNFEGNWWMNFFVRRSVISVGSSGFSVIPFTQYEWGIGTLTNTCIRTWYSTLGGLKGGCTTFIRVIPPNLGSEKFSGGHIVNVRSLMGLYLNIGDIGQNGKTFGQVVLLGRGYVNAVQL